MLFTLVYHDFMKMAASHMEGIGIAFLEFSKAYEGNSEVAAYSG